MSDPRHTFDSVLDLCQNQHRRIVLGILVAEQRSVTLNELTEAIIEYNHDTPPTEASDELLGETRISLHHHQLPKLAAEGFITYDPDREHAEATEQLMQVEPTVSAILDADPELEAPIEL